MKNIGLNILLILLPFLVFANRPQGAIKKTKVIQRRFEAGAAGQVYIDNMYGNIHVITGTQSHVSITVEISVDGDSNEAVQKTFERIDVNIIKQGSQITGKTLVQSKRQSWNLFSLVFGSSSNNTNFKINYTIKMPEQWDLKINNDYGHIFINRLTGDLDLNADYGHFEIGQLLGSHNRINIDYFSKSGIEFVKQATINADYSKISIDMAYRLNLNCDYTTVKIGNVRQLHFNNDYGSLHVDNVKEVNGSGDGQARYFGQVHSLRFSGDYGSVTIDGLLPGFDRIDLECDYTTIKIYNRKKVPYRLNILQEYGCFKYENLTVYREVIDGGDKDIKAFYLDRNSSSTIDITEDYGCIKIYN